MVPEQRRDQSLTSPEYYSYKLGHLGAGDQKKFTFLVSGKDEKRISGQGQVLNLFLKHRTKIISQWGYLDDARHEFVICLTCDMRNADITPDGLILELRLLKFVRNARSIRMENRLFDGFFFPVTLLDSRVIVLDSSITFLIEHELKSPEQKAALVEVGRVYAMDIVRQIRTRLPSSLPEKVLLDNVMEYFKAAGLGRFSLLDTDPNSIQAIVRDPPLSEKGEATGNHFLHGIVVGLVEAFKDRETTVVEDLYDPKAGRLFIALLDKRNVSTKVQPAGSEVKIRALEEIEKVISSIDGDTRSRESVPVISVNSSATLNQVLKNYASEGWVGGKIGYAEIPKESATPPIVVKYVNEQTSSEEKEEKITQSTVLVSKDSTTDEDPKSIQPPSEISEEKRKKRSKPQEREDEAELAKAIKSAMGEEDLYFEESTFLESRYRHCNRIYAAKPLIACHRTQY